LALTHSLFGRFKVPTDTEAAFMEERDDLTIEEAVMVASCLAALGGARHEEAERMLRAVADRATGKDRPPRVA
jgi:hypothetical protein